MAKVKAGGIIRNEHLAKIGVMSAPDRCGLACDVLRALGDQDINVEFIVQCIDLANNSHIVFCVREDDLDAALAAQVFEAMACAGINIQAISTSISTVSCLIDGNLVDDAVKALREHFDLP